MTETERKVEQWNKQDLPDLEFKSAKEVCPLCALDLKRIMSYYMEFYPDFHIYTCAMWKDVYHVLSASLGAELAKNTLVRGKLR